MGMGSCENSVIVEEPVPVPISGQRLCSEFTLQSVPEQQPCSELLGIESGSNLVGASAANGCGDSNSDSSYLSAGSITQMPPDVGTFVSEKNDSLTCGSCLDEYRMGGGESLQEVKQEGEDCPGNLVGDFELPLEDIPLDSLASGGCLNENTCDVDACTTERAEECLQESRPQAEDDIEKPTGNCELPLEAVPMADLAIAGCLNKSQNDIDASKTESRSEGEDGTVNLIECNKLPLEVLPLAGLVDDDCLNENHRDIVACHVERTGGCLQEGGQEEESSLVNSIGDRVLPLEDIPVASLVSGCCLNGNSSDVDPCKTEGAGKFLHECRPQAEDDVQKPNRNCELPIEVVPVADFAGASCLNENQSDFDASSKESVKESRSEGEDEIRNLIGNSELPLEEICVAYLANEDCLNENHRDINTCSTERAGDCLQQVRSEGKGCSGNLIGGCGLPSEVITVGGLASESCMGENLRDVDCCSAKLAEECLHKEGVEDMIEHCKPEVIPAAGLASGSCLAEIQGNVDACSEERSGECLQDSEPQMGDGFGNLTRDYDLSMEVIPVVGSPMNCIQQEEQKDDRSFDCLLADVKEVLELKNDALAIVKSDFCEQEPPLQDCESSELVPPNGRLDNIYEQKEQDIKSVDGSFLGNISGETVASAELEADPCKKIVSLQSCAVTLEVSHPSEDVSNCDQKIDQNNCTGCLSKGAITEAVGVERNFDTSNQLLLSRSPDTAQNERSVHTLTKRGTEFFVANNDVSSDIKLGICSLEENACNDKAVSPQCSQCLSVIDDGSSKRSGAPDQLDNSSQEPIKSGSAVDCCGQTDNQGKDIGRVKSEIVASSSQRHGGRSRSRRKTQTRKAARKGKKTAKASCSHESISIAFFKVTKKRSSLPKLVRSSAWGLLGNVTQLFEHSNGLEAIQVSNKGSQKSKGRRNNVKKNKIGVTARAQGSKKNQALNTSLRLRVKIGKGVHQSFASVPEHVDTSALCTVISCDGTELHKESPKVANGKVDDWEKGEISVHSRCFASNQDKATSYPGASVQEAPLFNNDLDSSAVIEKSAEDLREDYFGLSNVLVDASGGATENKCKDPGTSPDSEVINLIPDAHTDLRSHDDFHGTVTSHEDPAASGGLTSSKRGKKKNKLSGSGSRKDKPRPVKTNRVKPLKQYGRKANLKNGIHAGENLDSSASANASSNFSSDKEPSIVEPSPVSDETALKPFMETLKAETGAEADKIDHDPDTGVGLSKPENSKKSKAKGHKLPKGKPQGSDSGIKRVNARCKGEPKQKSVSKKKINKKCLGDQAASNVETLPDTENHMVDSGRERDKSDDKIASTNLPNLDLLPGSLGEQYIPPRNAWVRCDGCLKWRRIPTELADLIEETKCTWTCKDNVDKAFADCSTPQEKSNADINAELEISDASGEEDASGTRLTGKGLECRRPRDMQETVTCTTIRTNQFLHRNRKTQNIDEIMVCHCKPPSDGQLGCRDDCLNRMLNIECVQGACPCGELCSNQQFQKRKYAKLGKFQCGKKGYGLKLLEDVPKGNFLIEYVGEVLDMQAYEARQKEYALKGHKHFYFMTLNGSEVIDACVKGNKGRFINHSCEPNCQTEKWMVNGEICIGLFTLTDLKKGEEVTFDYNYVRVFGAAAKKCYCLSQQCRGYIGGDPLSGDVIIESDSDEDYPEAQMLHQNGRSGERNGVIRGARSSTKILKQTVESVLDDRDENDKGPLTLGQPETSTGKEDSISHSVSTVSSVHNALEPNLKEKLLPSVLPLEISQETEDSMSELMSTVQQESSLAEETPVKELSKSLSDGAYANRKPKSDNSHDKKLSSKGHAKVKTSRSSSSIKKAKVKSSPPNSSKVQLEAIKPEVPLIKTKKVLEGSFGSHFEAVEEKLNELLDPDGGISRRKDAARGYLKLLLLTSASGGTANAIQRNRDLSMILDALLKTRSRLVLVDIINKNGLRMLHKLINQYRRDFKKIPILRKLLKVLEYLAVREILTLEHIKEGPPHKGMESFRESFLSLTEHEDKQVHQIARNFRDRWIPKYLRRQCYLDRDDNKTEFSRSTNYNRYSPTRNNESDRARRPSEATDCVKQSAPATPSVDAGSQEGISASCVAVSQSSGTRTRKRKSRWDQPAETNLDLSSLQPKEQKTEHQQFESNPVPGSGELSVEYKDKLNREDTNGAGFVNVSCHVNKAETGHDEIKDVHDEIKDVLDDVPPGFSSTLKPSPDSSVASATIFHSNCPSDNVVGHAQEKFNSRLPVSYGIPLSIIQQFGTHEETAGSWVIAPGMPFQPFPPLPSFPRDKLKDPPPSGDSSHSSVNQPAEEAVHDSCLPAVTNSNDCSSSTTGDQPSVQISSTNNQFSSKRGRETSNDLGTRYFKQQKWNNTKLRPPWHWSRNSWGCRGGDPRGETNSVSVGNVTNELRSTYCSEDKSNQQPEHHTQH